MKELEYIVISAFTERIGGVRNYKPKEAYLSSSEERSKRLLENGFIIPVQTLAVVKDKEKPSRQSMKKKVNGDGSEGEGLSKQPE